MVAARCHAVGAGLLALAACGASVGQSDENMETVRFEPGMNLREMVSARLHGQLSPQVRANGDPFMVNIGMPHVLKLKVGTEEIELHPGGYNSNTSMITGFRPGGFKEGAKADYSRFGSLGTDTGSRQLPRRVARDLAINWCAIAEKGLSAKSRLDPAQVIDAPEIKVTDRSFPGYRASDVCIVENEEATFVVRYTGPIDILDEASPKKDDEEFRLNVSLSQTIR